MTNTEISETRRAGHSFAESAAAVVAFILNILSVAWVAYAALKPLTLYSFRPDYEDQVQSFLDVMSRGVPVSCGALWASLTLLVLQGERNRGVSWMRVGLSATALVMIWLVSSGAVDLIDTLSGAAYLIGSIFLIVLAGFTATRAGLAADIDSLSASSGNAALTSAAISSTAAVIAANNAMTCAQISTMNPIPPMIPPPSI